MAQVKMCPTCERRNLASNLNCQYCGTVLENTPAMDAPDLTAPKITLNDHLLAVPLRVELTIGRSALDGEWKPDIDLAPYGGTASAGVSRRHARLVWYGDWQIEDLNSANGTFLDRHRLEPGKRQVLKPGSVIQIGKLYLVFHG